MTKRSSIEVDNVHKTLAYYEGINNGDLDGFDAAIADDVIDHATYADGSSASLKAILQRLAGSMKVEVVRMLADHDFVAVQVRKTFAGAPFARIEWNVLRFKNGKAVELWSSGEQEAALNASGRSQIDGTTQISESANTDDNKALMRAFFEEVIIGADFSSAAAYYDGSKLIQHDPSAGDGVQAITGYSIGLAKAGTPQVFKQVRLLVGEGDFVLVATDLMQGDKARAYWELYRLEQSKIAERWLVADDIAPASEWKNSFGKF
jgi:predicted SnoaL-like aldol condensation-catalyzing enzyme